MIGKLRGKIDEIHEDSAIIDVGGVGYHVFASSRTLSSLAPGEAAIFTIETHIREDHFHLYGFPNTLERDWFRLLLTVQGVGAKIALTILGAYSPAQLVRAVLAKDSQSFRAISGIGPKLAERIVTELKDKVTKMPAGGNEPIPISSGKEPGGKKKKTEAAAVNLTEDAISALVNLGYTRSEAYAAAIKAQADGGKAIDQLIKMSLKELVRG